MTGPAADEGGARQEPVEGARPEPVETAVADLERLKETLQRAGRGEAGATEVQRAVTDYWRDHGDALTTVATAVGEQARSQMLAELYRWKAQLLQQGVGGLSTPSPARPADERPDSSDG
jgi:hypothetical protein